MAVILIGIADMNVTKSPDVLTTLGLGSCVGVVLYDRLRQIGGLAHIMLPLSNGAIDQNRAKFADTAIIDLINRMGQAGAQRAGLIAKIAGGAHMFGGSNSNVLKVGERNVAACIQVLDHLRIPIQAQDTGGSHGRTIELYTDTGALKIKTVGYGESTI